RQRLELGGIRAERDQAGCRRWRRCRENAGSTHGWNFARHSRKTSGRCGRCTRDCADSCAYAIEHRASWHTAYSMETASMIGRLKGILVAKQPPWIMVDVGGVGYELEAPMSTIYDLPEIGREVVLSTHYAVKEDSVALYGFLTE